MTDIIVKFLIHIGKAINIAEMYRLKLKYENSVLCEFYKNRLVLSYFAISSLSVAVLSFKSAHILYYR